LGIIIIGLLYIQVSSIGHSAYTPTPALTFINLLTNTMTVVEPVDVIQSCRHTAGSSMYKKLICRRETMRRFMLLRNVLRIKPQKSVNCCFINV